MKYYIFASLLLLSLFSCDTGGDPLGDALLEAAAQGKIDQMKVCIDNGVDINYINPKFLSTQMTACAKAAANGQLEALKWLVQQEADWHKATSGGENPITFAGKKGHFDIVYYLVEIGEKVNYQERNYGMNAILYASEKGNVEAIRKLMELGANKDSRNKDGKDPLSLAVHRHHAAAYNYWVKEQNMAIKDRHLFDAVEGGYISDEQKQIQMVQTILNAGIDINVQNSNKDTPLHIAYKYENATLIRFLKENGADESIKNIRDLTPLEVRGELVPKEAEDS
jgi:ankyrin repeat protein